MLNKIFKIGKEEVEKTLFQCLSDIAMTLIYISVPGYVSKLLRTV